MPATLKVKPREPRTGGGRRGPIDRDGYGGGGGGGRGDNTPNYGERLRRYRLGLGLAVVAIALLFGSLSVAFLVRATLGTWDAASATYVRDWTPVQLPMGLLAINTALLVLSSATIELARRQAAQRAVLAPVLAMPGISAGRRPSVPWLGISSGLGVAFLAGQALAWRNLAQRGVQLSVVPSSSLFYVLTGAHALHLLGGVVAMAYAWATTTVLSKSLDTRRLVVDITAWYWHVMAVLWIYIFAVLAVGRL